MNKSEKRYYETRPGLDTIRYLVSYGLITLLAKRAVKRPARFFTEVTSNIDRHIISEGLFEKGVIDLLIDLVRRTGHRDLMIDIGANIGNHTVAMAHLFEQVESVEPHPVLYRVLTANVLRNGLSHVTCHNFGLASEDAKATLAEPADNHSIARVKERSQLPPETFGLSGEAFGQEYAVDLRSARAFLEGFAAKLDGAFIKIDVEGMEEEILMDILPLLEQHKPVIGFEWFTEAQPDLGRVLAKLEGYEFWGIRMHDVGRNLAWRALKLLVTGRSFRLEKIDRRKLDRVYPLALLIPAGKLGR